MAPLSSPDATRVGTTRSKSVHFAALIITDKKPTQDVLEKALVHFGPYHQRHWLGWALGGRYTGNLIPIEPENTVTGARPELTDLEKRQAQYGLPPARGQERTGPGVDALQRKKLESVYKGFLPHAVVLQDQWHECEVFGRGSGSRSRPSSRFPRAARRRTAMVGKNSPRCCRQDDVIR
jgi:hypothetical protein